MSKINLPSLFNQMDSRWANTLLGFNTNSAYNFYNYACTITCMAMACKYFGKNVDPVVINDKLKAVKGFKAGTGLYLWGSITKVFGDIKEAKTETPSPLTDEQMGEIRNAIDSGYPVMVEIDYNPKTVATDMHFVLIIGYNPSDENDFLIADPLGGKERSLKDYLGWYRPSARKTIERYVIYTGPKPKVTSDMVVLSKDDAEKRTYKAEQWVKTVGYLELKTDPALTPFEDGQRVIAGFKSRATDLEKQLELEKIAGAKLQTEVDNQKDKLANVTEQCQNQLKLKDAEISTLKKGAASLDGLKGQYEGTIKELEGKLRDSQKAVGLKEIEITELKSKLNLKEKGVEVDKKTIALNYFGDLFQKLISKLEEILK